MITVRRAQAADGPALQDLQARCPQGTSLIIKLLNRPDFFGRANLYAEAAVFVAERDGVLAGSAACAIRPALVGGVKQPVGYEFQFFVAPEQRRQGVAQALRHAIEEYQRTHGAVLSYAAIIPENTPSLNLFTGEGFACVRKLPLLGLLPARPLPVALPVRVATPADLPAIAALCNATWQQRDLHMPLSADVLAALLERTASMDYSRLFVIEQDGALTACAGVMDWRAFMEIEVQGLSTQLKLLRWALRVGGLIRPLPQLPGPGEAMRQWLLTPVGLRNPGAMRSLVCHINNLALAEQVTFVFTSADEPIPFEAALKGFIRADTRLNIMVKYYGAARLRPGPLALPSEDA